MSQLNDELDELDGPDYDDDDDRGGGGAMGKRLLLILIPVVLLGGLVGALFFLTDGFEDFSFGGGEEMANGGSETPAVSSPAENASVNRTTSEGAIGDVSGIYFQLPEMLVNLQPTGTRSNFLKLTVSVELNNPADAAKVEQHMPKIVDQFQIYLRNLQVRQLQGTGGLDMLKKELTARINLIIRPAQVRDVLFKEVLVQ